MRPSQTLQLRLEMLRLRGTLERAEVAAALTAVRTGAAPLARIIGTVSVLQGGWVGALAARPAWAASAALLLLRVSRRHPRLLAAAAAGLALAWLVRRRAGGPAAGGEPAGSGSASEPP
jgi:hypothetical protein